MQLATGSVTHIAFSFSLKTDEKQKLRSYSKRDAFPLQMAHGTFSYTILYSVLLFYFRSWKSTGVGSLNGHWHLVYCGRSGIESRYGAIFFARVHTGPWDRPAFYTMDTGSSLGQSGRGLPLTTHPHLAPRLKKEYNYTSIPPVCLHGWLQVDFYLYLLL